MKSYTSWIVTALAVLAVIGGMVWYANRPGQYDTFATCIKDSGAKFFGAFWCPHCQEEKALFGKSVKNLPYVECSTPDGNGQTQVCIDNGIKGYPTWEFTKNGTTTRQTGVLSLQELSAATQCVLTKDTMN